MENPKLHGKTETFEEGCLSWRVAVSFFYVVFFTSEFWFLFFSYVRAREYQGEKFQANVYKCVLSKTAIHVKRGATKLDSNLPKLTHNTFWQISSGNHWNSCSSIVFFRNCNSSFVSVCRRRRLHVYIVPCTSTPCMHI